MTQSTSPSSRVAVVTGAGSGIGATVARRLGKRGYRVILGGRTPGNLSEVAAEIRGFRGPVETAIVRVSEAAGSPTEPERWRELLLELARQQTRIDRNKTFRESFPPVPRLGSGWFERAWPEGSCPDEVAVARAVASVGAGTPSPVVANVFGIDTGLVVIGQGDTLSEQERTAIGDAPNIAARLQGLAEPGSVVVSDRTHQLAAGSFDYRLLGAQDLKGVAEAMSAWQVLGERTLETRFDATTGALAAPMVGRGLEL